MEIQLARCFPALHTPSYQIPPANLQTLYAIAITTLSLPQLLDCPGREFSKMQLS